MDEYQDRLSVVGEAQVEVGDAAAKVESQVQVQGQVQGQDKIDHLMDGRSFGQVEGQVEGQVQCQVEKAVDAELRGIHTTCHRSELQISSPFKELFKASPSSIAAMADDMRQRGFIPAFPISVWRLQDELIVVDGHVRLFAATEAGCQEIPIVTFEFKDEYEALIFAIRSQTSRRNLSIKEIRKCLDAMDELMRRGERTDLAPNGAKLKGKTSAIIAKQVNKSPRTVERIAYVNKNASPEIVAAMDNETMTIGKAYELTKTAQMSPSTPAPHGAKDSCDGKDHRQSPATLNALFNTACHSLRVQEQIELIDMLQAHVLKTPEYCCHGWVPKILTPVEPSAAEMERPIPGTSSACSSTPLRHEPSTSQEPAQAAPLREGGGGFSSLCRTATPDSGQRRLTKKQRETLAAEREAVCKLLHPDFFDTDPVLQPDRRWPTAAEWGILDRNDFARWWDADKFNWKDDSADLAWHCSDKFELWWDSSRFVMSEPAKQALVRHCHEHEGKWSRL